MNDSGSVSSRAVRANATPRSLRAGLRAAMVTSATSGSRAAPHGTTQQGRRRPSSTVATTAATTSGRSVPSVSHHAVAIRHGGRPRSNRSLLPERALYRLISCALLVNFQRTRRRQREKRMPQITITLDLEADDFAAVIEILGRKPVQLLQGSRIRPCAEAARRSHGARAARSIEGNYARLYKAGLRAELWQMIYKAAATFGREAFTVPELAEALGVDPEDVGKLDARSRTVTCSG